MARGSALLAAEYFDRQDDRFVESVREMSNPKELAALADRWKQDPRPWAREQIARYLEHPLDRAGHQPLVKRLFKQAEERRDDELMALFFVAFDRLVRRVRRRRFQYDWVSRQVVEEEALVAPRDALPADLSVTRRFTNPMTGEPIEIRRTPRIPGGGRIFSYHTRYHLRRRVWRYFRRMARQRPRDYPLAVAKALARYRDEDLARGEQILDSWSLVHAGFGRHDALEFTTSQVRLKERRSLAELNPAPWAPELWGRPESLDVLLMLLVGAKSRLVRVWTLGLLRGAHRESLRELHPADLVDLLRHEDEEVQQFAAETLESSKGLDALPLDTWLEFLNLRNHTVLETVCRVMAQHVRAERLSLTESVRLASAEPTPVARLGFGFLRSKEIRTDEDRRTLVGVSAARSEAVAGEIAAWALPRLVAEGYDREPVTPFFDSPTRAVREAAWGWLVSGSAGYDDPVLWSRLLETPYDDLRLRLVDTLSVRAALPRPSPQDLTAVWCSVLAGVHRGGRQKPKAVRQVADAIARDADRAADLLPVLAVALRSVRGPEMREALSAVVTLVARRPDLAPVVQAHVPELTLDVPAACQTP